MMSTSARGNSAESLGLGHRWVSTVSAGMVPACLEASRGHPGRSNDSITRKQGQGPVHGTVAIIPLRPIAAPLPVVGLSSVMLDCENEDAFRLVPVDDIERETRHSPLTLVATRGGADIGRLRDLRRDLFDDSQEPKSKPFATLFIASRCCDKLGSRCAVKINRFHRRASRAR